MAKLHKGTNIPDFENLRLILSSICLRRRRAMLPNKGHAEETRQIMFTETERHQYNLLESACKAAVKMGSKKRGNDQVHRGVMEALLRLRMFCNDGPHIQGMLGNSPEEILSFFQQSDEAMCASCSADVMSLGPLGDPTTGFLAPCQRLLCSECIDTYKEAFKNGPGSKCALCQNLHPEDGWSPDSGLDASPPRLPSKIIMLVDDIRRHELADKW